MTKIKKIELNMRQDNLEKLLFSYLSGYAPSRASVAKACSVSSMTSGKVANALLRSGFMVERVFSSDGCRQCSHLFCRANANVLIIDISSSIFKMSIANAYGEIKFHGEYEYTTELFPDDNLNIFLSRCGTAAMRSSRGFFAIAVIYADNDQSGYTGAHLPLISDKESVSHAVFDIFGKRPTSHITISQAISEAIRFKAHGDISGGISYIFVGDHLSLFHVYENGSVTVCAAHAMLGRADIELLSTPHYMTGEDADRIFVDLCNIMGAAFSPSAILLESDVFSPDADTVEKIIRRFALSAQNPPRVYAKDNEFPLCLIGTVRSTLFKVIKRYITT